MVFFTCGTCGSSLKKNQVEKHSYQCRTFGNLSCMDCNKDFAGDDYKLHTKCISEVERYSAKGWKPAANHNKGQKKQHAWLEVVQATLLKAGNTLKPVTKNLLNTLTKHDNVPRKKPKFLNFIANVTRRQFDDRTVEEVWDLLEAQWKLDKPAPAANGGINGMKNGENRTSSTNGSTDLASGNSVKDKPSADKPEKKKRKKKAEESLPEPVRDEFVEEEGTKKKKKRKAEDQLETTVESGSQTEELLKPVPDKKKKKKRKADDELLLATAENVEKPEQLPETELVKKKKKRSQCDEEGQVETEPIQTEVNGKKSKKKPKN